MRDAVQRAAEYVGAFAADTGLHGKAGEAATARALASRDRLLEIVDEIDRWAGAHGVARSVMRDAADKYTSVLGMIPDPYVLGHVGDEDPKNQAAIQAAFLQAAQQRAEAAAASILPA